MLCKLMEKNTSFKLFLVIVYTLLFVFISCNQEKTKTIAILKTSGTKLKISFKDSLRNERLKEYADFYIAPINNGIDSFELRILHEPFYQPNAQLTTILYVNNRLTILKTFFWGRVIEDTVNEIKDSLGNLNSPIINVVTDSFFTKRVNTRIATSAILDSLKQLNVLNIPDQEEQESIPDQIIIAPKDSLAGSKPQVIDGDYYIIDVATKKQYNIIQYYEPSAYTDKKGYNKRVAALIKYVEKI